jgi:hypothetical protein
MFKVIFIFSKTANITFVTNAMRDIQSFFLNGACAVQFNVRAHRMCTCSNYDSIELTRASVSGRIKASRQLKKSLDEIAAHSGGEHKLYVCRACGQFWQGSRAWNWGNDLYLFRIPEIEATEWLKNVYVQPDDLLIYAAVMHDLLEKGNFVPSDQACRLEGCTRNSMQGLVTCLPHHVASLQRMGRFPLEPSGRWFEPYSHDCIVPKLLHGARSDRPDALFF